MAASGCAHVARAAGLFAVALTLRCALPPPAPSPSAPARFVPSAADLAFLRELARDVAAAARVAPPRSEVGFPLLTPAGRGGYPAFWVRDFSMAVDGGVVPRDELAAHLAVIARAQNGASERRLAHGLVVPPFAIPDHVALDGGAVFYPGTYATGDDQGDGAYGTLPPADGPYEFIHLAHALWRADGRADALRAPTAGLPLLERLERAFAVPLVDEASGAVVTSLERRAVGFGFCDGIVLTGELLFATLLRERAALELAELVEAAHGGEAAARAAALRSIAATIRARVAATFADDAGGSGWLIAATGIGRQPDVWGTLFALKRGVLAGPARERALAAVVDAVQRGTIALEAAVRHVPLDRDARADSAWGRTAGVAHGSYQNGAFWHVATGWLVAALAEREPELAARLFDDFVAHLRRHDFRRGPDEGAPWECFGRDGPRGRLAQNGAYVASITLPLAAFEELAQRK